MKIGIVLPSVPGYSETFFTNKINGLQANGFQVLLFVNSLSDKSNPNLNCDIVVAPKFTKNKIRNSLLSFYYLIKALIYSSTNVINLYKLDKKDKLKFSKRIKGIIINSYILSHKLDWLHFGFGTMAIDRENVAQAIGAKMAVSFRGFDHYVYPIKNKDCYKSLFSKVVKYHVLSNEMKKDLISFSINKNDIIKITPAINVNFFSNRLPFKNENNFITVSRLHWIKGLEYSLEALSIVSKKGIDFSYTIIGEGKEKERLQFLAHQLGINNKVIFLGKLPPNEVKQELSKASYYLQYSLQEGFCNSVVEAQAMGKICIVSDADGLKENISNNDTGFIVTKRNSELLANKICEVINMTLFEKEKIIHNAVERINSSFTLEEQLKKFIDFYKN